MIERCLSVEQDGWLALRQALWPHCHRERHVAEMSAQCASPEHYVAFVAHASPGSSVGFVEAAVRADYVNGTESSPVAFLEGVYVVPDARNTGIARALVSEVERWAVSVGCNEFASDASVENLHSHLFHRALGFKETERVVFFRKLLT